MGWRSVIWANLIETARDIQDQFNEKAIYKTISLIQQKSKAGDFV